MIIIPKLFLEKHARLAMQLAFSEEAYTEELEHSCPSS